MPTRVAGILERRTVMTATTVVAAQRKKILRAFEQHDATDPERARTPDEVGCRDSLVFRSLVRRGVLREAGGGRYYLDLESASRLRARQRAMALIAVLAIVTLVILMRWFG
jgi:hypothetical protein